MDAWQQCALSGCLWCRFLEKHFLQDLVHWPDWPFPRINVSVRAAEMQYDETPLSIAVLLKYCQKASYKTFDLYASAGMMSPNVLSASTLMYALR